MMTFENVQIQLVDLPPLGGERVEPWMHNLLRGANLLLMVIDLDDDPVPQVRNLIRHLEQQKVKTVGSEVAQDVDEELEFFEDRTALKRALLVGNKKDLEMSSLSLEILQNEYGKAFTIVSTSAVSGDGLDELRATIFKDLEIVRAYTKAPGKEADLAAPFILKKGSTVQDLAEHIHKDFVDKFKYARVWGPGRFQGQRVHREFVLEDGDVIELHM
jgi:ribosome-interacting GTPase 1